MSTCILKLEMCCGYDSLIQHMGPIEIPEEDDALLRIDFIREVDDLLVELEAAAAEIEVVSGLD